jgi:hypothetical protein
MVKIVDVRNSKERDGFWKAYRACAEENRVRPDRSPFYVNWAKDFANFLPGKPLKDRSREDERHTAAAPAGKHPVQEAIAKTDGFRDRVIPGEVERQFSELIEAVKTEVRTRHYSYRTETAHHLTISYYHPHPDPPLSETVP